MRECLQQDRIPVANVLGIGVHAVNIPSAIEIIRSAIQFRRKGYVCVTGVHGVMEAHREQGFREAISGAMLVVPDGMPTVWIGRWQGHRNMRRVFGPELMWEFCRQTASAGYTHFFYGGKPGIAEELVTTLRSRIPDLRIVGTDTPSFGPPSAREKVSLRQRLEKADPDVIWVGLSTPKQELFMAENITQLNCRVMVGVGAAFDYHTGKIKDSPSWMKNAGLQWLHRLYQEPARLWKRYLVNNSGFVAKFALQLVGLRTYELEETRGKRR